MNTIERESRRIEGRVSIVVRDAHGTAVCERRASNVVLRAGAELVAALLSGKATTPINGVIVGVNSEPPSPPYEGGAVTTTAPDGTPVIELAAAPIDPAIIAAEVLADELKVRISLRSVIGPNRAASPICTVLTF